MTWRHAVLFALAITATGHAHATPEIVCDVAPMIAGRMDGGTFRSEGPVVDGARPLRLTFSGHDRQAGTALLRVGDETGSTRVGMTVDKGAIVYLLEESGVGKFLISTATASSPDGYSAVATRHEWANGALTIRVFTGACRVRGS